jgi:hypothetical protein
MRTYRAIVGEGYHETAQWLVDTRGSPLPLDDEESDDDEEDYDEEDYYGDY